MPVWDIINAGPRHRFTADGHLVSNSAYGASPLSLERKIESDTGVKPEAGVGQKGLDAIAERQPVLTQFMEYCAAIPGKQGFARSLSGRVRHCVTHSRESGVSWRIRQSQESAMGREMRNFFPTGDSRKHNRQGLCLADECLQAVRNAERGHGNAL